MGNGGLFGLGDFGNLLGGVGAIYGLSQLGKTPVPSVGESTEDAYRAFLDYFPTNFALNPDGSPKLDAEGNRVIDVRNPGYSQIVRDEAARDLAAQLARVQQFARPQAEQQLALAQEFIPKYSDLSATEAYLEAMRNAATGASVLRGPGGELIDEAQAAARRADPEFYGRRAQTSSMLGDLLRSFAAPGTVTANNPFGTFTGALSGSERAEIERSLAQNRARSGSIGGPMAMSDVVANAMMFGQGVQNRRDALGRALGQATSFLPASRSGFDPFQVAMGRPSQQFGAQLYQPPTTQTNTAGMAGDFMGNTFGLASNNMKLQANQPSMLNRIGTAMQTFPGISGGLSWSG